MHRKTRFQILAVGSYVLTDTRCKASIVWVVSGRRPESLCLPVHECTIHAPMHVCYCVAAGRLAACLSLDTTGCCGGRCTQAVCMARKTWGCVVQY